MIHHFSADTIPIARIQLLGSFQMTLGTRVLVAGDWRRKAAHLVKLLALTDGRSLSRDQVLEILWPESEPEAAANNFYQTLHMARTILAGGARKQQAQWLRLHD